MSIRIASFNVENLMERFDFAEERKSAKNLLKRATSATSNIRIIAHEDDARQMTAQAIADCHADLFCLQEVENLRALEAFEEDYLTPMTGLVYPQKVWIEGNDGRGIDVALMARNETRDGEKIQIDKVKSHAKRTFGELGVHNDALKRMGYDADERVFRRDCLEVNLRIGGKRTTIFVCHFKSMGSNREGVVGRDYTMPVREAEALGVRRIIEEKFGTKRASKMRWLVCGDLNDYRERVAIIGDSSCGYKFKYEQETPSGIDPLFADGFSKNLIERRERDNRWSLYFAHGISKDRRYPEQRPVHHLVQLDYLLASPAISTSNSKALPHIVRNGQPYRTVFPPNQEVERYPRTGLDRPKASDHCPVAVTLKIV